MKTNLKKFWLISGISLGVVIIGVILICMFKNGKLIELFRTKDVLNDNRLSNDKLVVSTTTIPSRLQFINEIIENMYNQTFRPDYMYVNIPYIGKRSGKPYDNELVEQIDTKNGWVKIVRGEDLGPATKLLGSLFLEKDPNTMIITVDDDQIYDNDIIQLLVNRGEENPNSALGTRGLYGNLGGRERCKPKTIYEKSPQIGYLEGFGGVLYRRKFFDFDILNYYKKDITKECFLSDDLVISNYLKKKGIERIRICTRHRRKDNKKVDLHDALHRESRKEAYDKCSSELSIEILKTYLKRITKILEKNSIIYWLDCGTLLGAYREKNIIKHDNDIDLGYIFKDREKIMLTLQKSLPNTSFKIVLHGSYNENIRIEIINSDRKILPFDNFDLYGYSDKGNFVQIQHYGKPIPKNWIFPLKKLYLGKDEYPVPNKTFSYLNSMYGSLSSNAFYSNNIHLYTDEKQGIRKTIKDCVKEKNKDKNYSGGIVNEYINLYKSLNPEWWKKCVSKTEAGTFYMDGKKC